MGVKGGEGLLKAPGRGGRRGKNPKGVGYEGIRRRRIGGYWKE